MYHGTIRVTEGIRGFLCSYGSTVWCSRPVALCLRARRIQAADSRAKANEFYPGGCLLLEELAAVRMRVVGRWRTATRGTQQTRTYACVPFSTPILLVEKKTGRFLVDSAGARET